MFNLRLILYSRLLEAVPIQVQQPKPKYDNRKVFFLSSDIPSDTKKYWFVVVRIFVITSRYIKAYKRHT